MDTMCHAEVAPTGGTSGQASDEGFFTGPDELTCAICLGQIPPPDLAMVAGCEHLYCVHCILSWALCKEAPSCPQCKHKFQHLFVHRQLDGTITDFPVRESVCLLQRATWFEDRLSTNEKAKLSSGNHYVMADEHDGGFYDDEDYDYDDDEDYYFSSAAGRARIVIGNRRFGENGFVQSGRRYARPTSQQQPAASKAKDSARGKSQQASQTAASSQASANTRACSSSSVSPSIVPGQALEDGCSSSSQAAASSGQSHTREGRSRGKKGKGKAQAQTPLPTPALRAQAPHPTPTHQVLPWPPSQLPPDSAATNAALCDRLTKLAYQSGETSAKTTAHANATGPFLSASSDVAAEAEFLLTRLGALELPADSSPLPCIGAGESTEGAELTTVGAFYDPPVAPLSSQSPNVADESSPWGPRPSPHMVKMNTTQVCQDTSNIPGSTASMVRTQQWPSPSHTDTIPALLLCPSPGSGAHAAVPAPIPTGATAMPIPAGGKASRSFSSVPSCDSGAASSVSSSARGSLLQVDVGELIDAAIRPGMGRRAKRSARRHVVDSYVGSWEEEDARF